MPIRNPLLQLPKAMNNFQRVVVGVSSVALVLAVKLLLLPLLPSQAPFLLFSGAILISTWIGGLVSGLLATVLAALSAGYLFIEPTHSLTLNPEKTLQVLLYCFEGALISTLTHLAHTAYEQAKEEIEVHERIEKALRESEERFRLLVEGVKDYAIFALDSKGVIISWNTGAERLKGYTAEEVIGKPFYILYPPEEASEKPFRLMKTAIEEGSVEDEGWRRRKDGSHFWANVTLTSLWENNQLRGFAKVTRDMTERRQSAQLAEALKLEQVAREEAERANELKIRFLGMISHELRTPLTSIKGYTTTLLAEDVEWQPEQRRQFLIIIDEEADRLRELIDQLLNLSQIQAGVFQIQVKAHPLSTSLELAQEQLRVLTANHQLHVTIPPDLPTVRMDERRIAQVIVNIVGNSVKYAPKGSTIAITAFRIDDMVQVEIHDEGPGIPEDQRENVFEAFGQLGRQLQTESGVGLGLAICKGLVIAHGGHIWVKDEPPPGTTIVFTLPLAIPQ
jgi:PAS domain S-box-containing protein